MDAAAGFDRDAITVEMSAASQHLRARLQSMSPEQLRMPSQGTRWTNEQLLFHMVFGYMVVRVLLGLVRVVSRLPQPLGRAFAAGLDACTMPFDFVNYWGSRFAAIVYNRTRMAAKFDRVVASLLRRLDRETTESLARAMPYPTRWDPFFKPLMTLADLYHYPTQHFWFHDRQLRGQPPTPRPEVGFNPPV